MTIQVKDKICNIGIKFPIEYEYNRQEVQLIHACSSSVTQQSEEEDEELEEEVVLHQAVHEVEKIHGDEYQTRQPKRASSQCRGPTSFGAINLEEVRAML